MNQPFIHEHRVSYADCTLGNHIYHARYLDLLEVARGALFRHLGRTFLQYQEQGLVFPVIEARLTYKAPARYDDVIAIETWPTLAEGLRLNFAYRIIRPVDKVIILEGFTFHVCTNLEEKPRRLPAELTALLQPLIGPLAT